MYEKEELRQYVESRRAARRDLVWEIMGRRCVRCGSTDELELDHVDPDTKLFTISSGMTRKLDSLLAELEKCQVLCRECHVEKSAAEQVVEFCSAGHAMVGDNLKPRGGKRSGFRCRACSNKWNAEYKQRNRHLTAVSD